MHNLNLQDNPLAVENVNYLVFIRVAVTFKPQPQELLKKHNVNRWKPKYPLKLYTSNTQSMKKTKIHIKYLINIFRLKTILNALQVRIGNPISTWIRSMDLVFRTKKLYHIYTFNMWVDARTQGVSKIAFDLINQ